MSTILTKPNLNIKNLHGIYTVSDEMVNFVKILERVARTDASVLLRGETGTGKELVARAIAKLSRRDPANFAAINCATLTSELLASELFGHIKGAFTGAVKDKKGLFQVVDKGTFFLDEVGEMPLDIQARLLRVLQEQVIVPLGSTTPIKVDVRIISATNRSLRELVEKGKFREDLMYRIRVVPLFLPPLVDRRGDIEALTWHFIEVENKKGFRNIEKIEKKVLDSFQQYGWPGNIRELRNNIEYAFAVGEGNTLRLQDLTPELLGLEPEASADKDVTAQDIERERIVEALKKAGGRKGQAADILQMSRSTLWRKMREHRIII